MQKPYALSLTRQNLALLALLIASFAWLPSVALDYGLFDATAEERLAAMGSARPFLTGGWLAGMLILLSLRYGLSTPMRGRVQALLALGVGVAVCGSAWLAGVGLGYATLVLFGVLIFLAAEGLAVSGFLQGDKGLIGALLLAASLVLVFILFPTVKVFLSIFINDAGEWQWDLPLSLFARPYLGLLMGNSLRVALLVGLLSTLFGLLFALYSTRMARRTQWLSQLFAILPMVTPPFVVGLGLSLMLGKTGYITQWLVPLGLDAQWFAGFNGIVFSQTLALTPTAFLIIEGGLKALPPQLEEAAYMLRGGSANVLWRVILPLLKPALANAFLLNVVHSLADFGTPLVVGGSFDVMATQIYFSIVGSQLDYPLASLLGLILLLFSLLLFYLQQRWLGNASYTTLAGKRVQGNFQPLPRAWRYGIGALLSLWIAFNGALYGSILLGGFVENWGVDSRFSLAHYQTLFGEGWNAGAFPSLWQTLLFALIAAPLSTALGIVLAYLIARKRFFGRRVLEFCALLSFAIPGTVAGLAFLLAFNGSPLYLTGTIMIMVMSMAMRNMPVGMRAAMAGLAQIDTHLDEAALSLNASSTQTLRHIILPLLRPALFSAMSTSFVRAMTTVSAIVFLVTADLQVATAYILQRVENGDFGLAVAYGALLIVLMLAVLLLMQWLIQRSGARPKCNEAVSNAAANNQ